MLPSKLFSQIIIVFFLLSTLQISAQTNPSPQSLPYSQDFSSLLYASTTYPAGLQGWKISAAATTTIVTSGPTADHTLTASASASTTAGGVDNYNGKIGFLASTSTNPGIVLSINAGTSSNIHVNYDIMVIRNPYDGGTNTRINESVLQYRIGEAGSWTTLTGVEYVSNTVTQIGSGITTPQNLASRSIILPALCNNQSIVQIRWLNHDQTGSGSRPSFAIDNIIVAQDNDGDGYVVTNDCNDANASIHPGTSETCNSVDDNCDGNTDEGLTFTTYFIDADGDDFGDDDDPGVSLCADPGAGFSNNSDDCDDTNSSVNPLASETCNNIDDNCDGNTDEGLAFTSYFVDADGDGYGDNDDPGVSLCADPGVGFSTGTGDCDDANSAIHPGVIDLCDGIDADCDGNIDEDALFTTYYIDFDNDSYGDYLSSGTLFCTIPGSGFSLNNTDCNDGETGIHPGASEICNNTDDNCNGNIDEGLTFDTWYADTDADFYGDELNTVSTCDGAPSGYIADYTDCNDAIAAINPGAAEICNGIDDNCDGNTDDDLITAIITPSGPTTFCSGSDVTLNANTGAGYIYQWNKNGTPVPGATAASYTTTKAADYTVRVTIPGGCFDISDIVTTVKLAAPTAAITNQDATNDICFDPSIKLKSNGGAGYAWQWYKGINLIAGATNVVYFATTAGAYRVVTTLTATGCTKKSAPYTIIQTCRENESASNETELLTYPNPNAGTFSIHLNFISPAEKATVMVYNLMGEIVYDHAIDIANNEINQIIELNNASTGGIYLIKVIAGTLEFNSSVVVGK